MARLVEADGNDGPYVEAGLTHNGGTLALALRAVSVAAGRRGMDLGLRTPDAAVEIWLDTGMPPSTDS